MFVSSDKKWGGSRKNKTEAEALTQTELEVHSLSATLPHSLTHTHPHRHPLLHTLPLCISPPSILFPSFFLSFFLYFRHTHAVCHTCLFLGPLLRLPTPRSACHERVTSVRSRTETMHKHFNLLCVCFFFLNIVFARLSAAQLEPCSSLGHSLTLKIQRSVAQSSRTTV